MFQKRPQHRGHRGATSNQTGEVYLRLPREGEILGVVVSMKGGSRMVVQCEDGKERMARIPGKIRRKIWIKDGDIVLVIPWQVQGDEKADISFRYTHVQAEQLKQRGLLKLNV